MLLRKSCTNPLRCNPFGVHSDLVRVTGAMPLPIDGIASGEQKTALQNYVEAAIHTKMSASLQTPVKTKRPRRWLYLGLFCYGLSLLPAPYEVRLPLNLAGAVALTLYTARRYRVQYQGQGLRAFQWAVMVALSPTWLLAESLAAAWLLPLYGLAPKWLWALALLGYAAPFALVYKLSATPPARLKRLAMGLTVSLLSALLTLLAMEIGLRVVRPKSNIQAVHENHLAGPTLLLTLGKWAWLLTGQTRTLVARNYELASVYPDNPRGYFEPGNRITYINNAQGFRDDDFTLQARPGTLRVALLGDSLAFGQGVKQHDIAPALLEPLLTKRAGCPVEVYNFALGGFNAEQEANQLEKTVWNYRPDLVLVWYSMTDIENMADGRRAGIYNQTPWISPRWARLSRLAGLLNHRLSQVTNKRFQDFNNTYYDPQGKNWKDLQTLWRSMAQSAQTHKTPLMLFVHPTMGSTDNYPQIKEAQQVVAGAQAAGLTAFDLLPAFAGYAGQALTVHPSDQHPNEIAHRLTAEYAADKIAARLPPCPH